MEWFSVVNSDHVYLAFSTLFASSGTQKVQDIIYIGSWKHGELKQEKTWNRSFLQLVQDTIYCNPLHFWGSLLFIILEIAIWTHPLLDICKYVPSQEEELKVTLRASAFCSLYFLWCLMLFILLKLNPPWDGMRRSSKKITRNNFLTRNVAYKPLLRKPFLKVMLLMLLLQKQWEHSRSCQYTRICLVGNVPSSKKRWKRGFALETC